MLNRSIPSIRGRSLLWMVCCVLALSAVTHTGCASRPKPAKDDYAGLAKYNYEEALDSMEGGDYLDALKRLRYVRTKFYFSKYAALSALRIGDVFFRQGKMNEAIGAFRSFLQAYPTHPDAPYASYKIGLARYEQLPGDWFFMPPSYEKDLATAEEAEGELRRFVERYPNSPYTEEIFEKLTFVRQRLADHEFYVAVFYLKRNEPRAAAMRLQGLLERYDGLGFDASALFLLGKSYLLLQDVAKAVQVWQRLVSDFPKHPLAGTAQEYMAAHNLQSP